MSSTLSSTSTFDEVNDAYDDNGSYFEDASRTKALAFVTACTLLARLTPMNASRDGQATTKESLMGERQEAKDWLLANPGSSGSGSLRVRFGDFQRSRD